MMLGKLALVGTGRGAVAPITETPVDDFLPDLTHLNDERRVLLTAGALSVFRRAGYVPGSAAPLPEPAPPDVLPACSPGATDAIRAVFVEGRLELLPEAFTLLARAGQRVPSSLLVDCLDLRDPPIHDAARPVLGERGRWLAGYRSAWRWAGDVTPAVPDVDALRRVWDEGRFEERLASITRLRELNPTLAREWIAATWSHEPSESRLALLETLASGLSPLDEAWLSKALEDRARGVRAEAASLLARLPGSAVAARSSARADAFLEWDRNRGGGLRVTPPEAFDPAWEADGFSARPPRRTGERAHWLMQALALVEPDHWSEHFGASRGELARAAWKTDWGTAVLIGWSRAAVLHDAQQWIVALFDAWLDAEIDADPHDAATQREILIQLFMRMPIDAAEARLSAALADPRVAQPLDVARALERFETPWTEAMGARVLSALEKETALHAATGAMSVQFAHVLRAAGPALPASQFDRAVALISQGSSLAPFGRLSRELELFAQQIRLRAGLHREIER